METKCNELFGIGSWTRKKKTINHIIETIDEIWIRSIDQVTALYRCYTSWFCSLYYVCIGEYPLKTYLGVKGHNEYILQVVQEKKINIYVIYEHQLINQ